MINMRQVIRQGLREDGALSSQLGADSDGEIKVYTFPLKPNVRPPYVAVSLIPVPGVDGVYGDDEVMERFVTQLTAWAKSDKEAWSVAVTLESAIRAVRFQVAPYEHTSTTRYQNVETMEDPDEHLWGVVMRYEIMIGR